MSLITETKFPKLIECAKKTIDISELLGHQKSLKNHFSL